MAGQYHSISKIVATVYCERQAILDRQHGRTRSKDVEAKAREGTFEHERFAWEGRTQATVDRRCFIASAVYGGDAPQTDLLRAWRDRILMPRRLGRWVVVAYYATSPWLVRRFGSHPRLTRVVRYLLDVFVARLGGAK